LEEEAAVEARVIKVGLKAAAEREELEEAVKALEVKLESQGPVMAEALRIHVKEQAKEKED
jgi:hypothetical protein